MAGDEDAAVFVEVGEHEDLGDRRQETARKRIVRNQESGDRGQGTVRRVLDF